MSGNARRPFIVQHSLRVGPEPLVATERGKGIIGTAFRRANILLVLHIFALPSISDGASGPMSANALLAHGILTNLMHTLHAGVSGGGTGIHA